MLCQQLIHLLLLLSKAGQQGEQVDRSTCPGRLGSLLTRHTLCGGGGGSAAAGGAHQQKGAESTSSMSENGTKGREPRTHISHMQAACPNATRTPLNPSLRLFAV